MKSYRICDNRLATNVPLFNSHREVISWQDCTIRIAVQSA